MRVVKKIFNLQFLALALITSIGLVANQGALALTSIDFSGWTEVEIENPDYDFDDPNSSQFLGTAVVSIFGDFVYDEMATETSANNFSGAAYSLSLILDLSDWIPDGQPNPPGFQFPYFTDFQSNSEYQNGDLFVGNNGGQSEFGVSFPVFNGPALLNEPFDFILVANNEVFPAGDLLGATNVLLNAADPLSLFDRSASNIYYQGPLGEGLEDDLFFEFSELSVSTVAPVPLPVPLLMISLPLIGLLWKKKA